jgi:hypothetical protein
MARLTWLALVLFTTVPRVASGQEVQRLADGTWTDPLVVTGNGWGHQLHHVWVDIQVQNLGYHKDVGIRWTDDGWATWQDATAWYEADLGWGFERWGVDLTPVGAECFFRQAEPHWADHAFVTSGEGPCGPSVPVHDDLQPIGDQARTVQYAVYYTDPSTGWTWWDNNGGADYSLVVLAP